MISIGWAVFAILLASLAAFALGIFVALRGQDYAVAGLEKEAAELKRRLNRVIEQETASANGTVKRIIRLAKGELI